HMEGAVNGNQHIRVLPGGAVDVVRQGGDADDLEGHLGAGSGAAVHIQSDVAVAGGGGTASGGGQGVARPDVGQRVEGGGVGLDLENQGRVISHIGLDVVGHDAAWIV